MMGIEKLGIRWGRGQKRKSAKSKSSSDLQREVATNSRDLDALSVRVMNLELLISELESELEIQLPHYVDGRRVR